MHARPAEHTRLDKTEDWMQQAKLAGATGGGLINKAKERIQRIEWNRRSERANNAGKRGSREARGGRSRKAVASRFGRMALSHKKKRKKKRGPFFLLASLFLINSISPSSPSNPVRFLLPEISVSALGFLLCSSSLSPTIHIAATVPSGFRLSLKSFFSPLNPTAISDHSLPSVITPNATVAIMASNDKGLEDIPEGMRRLLFFSLLSFIRVAFRRLIPSWRLFYFTPLTRIKSQDHGY